VSDTAGQMGWYREMRAAGAAIRTIPYDGGIRDLARHLRDLILEFRPSVVHTHFTRYDIPAAVALMLLAPGQRPRLVWHVHSPTEHASSASRALKDLLKWRVLGRVALTIVVSDGGHRHLLSRGAIARRTIVVHNGVDTARVDAPTEPREAVRAQLGVPPEARACLLYGWTPHRKGVDVALEAFRLLSTRDPRAVLVAVGEETLRAFVDERLGPGARPAWLRVVPSRPDVGALLGAADLFVCASRAEGFPYAVAEAIAARLPVVSTDIAGLEWTRELGSVRLCAPESPSALADQIAAALAEPEDEARARASASREVVLSRYSIEAWTEDILRAYAALSPAPAAPSAPIALER
jgi:glycosyltransferase involved in cell wall biosynthesis